MRPQGAHTNYRTSPHHITTVLFDLDSTLYPASSAASHLFDERITAFVRERLDVDEATALEIRREYLTTYGTTLNGLEHNHTIDREEYIRYVHDIELAAFLQLDAELDRQLAELPMRKAIFTNAPREHAERVLDLLGIAHHFERIFDLRLFEFRPKPEPLIYDFVLAEMGVAGREAVFVEDTAHNLLPARERGMTTILLAPEGHAYPPEAADFIVPDIFAALQVIRSLNR